MFSFLAAGDNFNQMITKLRLYGAVDLIELAGEDDRVKLPDHLAGAELPQVPALFTQRTMRMLFSDLVKIRAALYVFLQLLALIFRFYQYMFCSGLCHIFFFFILPARVILFGICLLYTSDAADE